MSARMLRLLFMPRESFPTDRVRINVLFGSELIRRGHRIDLAMQAGNAEVQPGPHPWHGCSLWVGPTDVRDGFLHRLRKHVLALRHDLQSLQRARPSRYDALLVSDKFLFAVLAVAIAKRRGLKFIYWLTFPYPEIESLGARTRTARYPLLARVRGALSAWALYRWILPRSDHIFVQSERMKEQIARRGIAPQKMSPILTGFDPTDIAPLSRPHAAPERNVPIVLAYLGTLSADRHLEILIEMLASLRERRLQAKLLLVGYADRPRDRVMLEHRARQLNVSHQLEITGFLPQEQALARIANADIGLSPIYRSPVYDVGSPTKLIEYLALGMPVVANDHPEQRLILRESRAGVCTPWGAQHFARAVAWLMARTPLERASMAASGRAWVEANRTYRRIADNVEQVLTSVLAPNSNASPARCNVSAGIGLNETNALVEEQRAHTPRQQQ